MKNYLLKFKENGGIVWLTVQASDCDEASALAYQIEEETRKDVACMWNATWIEYNYVCIELGVDK